MGCSSGDSAGSGWLGASTALPTPHSRHPTYPPRCNGLCPCLALSSAPCLALSSAPCLLRRLHSSDASSAPASPRAHLRPPRAASPPPPPPPQFYQRLREGELTEDYLWETRLLPLLGYLSAAEATAVREALSLAYDAHSGQRRKSGEPFITHPVEVTRILAELRMDYESLVAGEGLGGEGGWGARGERGAACRGVAGAEDTEGGGRAVGEALLRAQGAGSPRVGSPRAGARRGWCAAR